LSSDSPRLILASASPRRREILERAGYVFEIVEPGDAEEAVAQAASPEELAILKARAKAHAVALALRGPFPAWVVGADTLVATSGRIVGKPVDRADAVAILTGLSGTRHAVISGVSVVRVDAPGVVLPPREFAATTWVDMRVMSAGEIEAYVNSGEADGKAGAYAIQERGDRFVEKFDGSFFNIVGFPLEQFETEILRAPNSSAGAEARSGERS
jgi:septum formation protein